MVKLRVTPLITQASPQKFHAGRLQWAGNIFPCALGEMGIKVKKNEGDAATPMGKWRVTQVFFRADRMSRPFSRFPLRIIQKNLGWCDDITSSSYNRLIKLPTHAGHEAMWREDRLYDIVIVLDYNFTPRVKNRGSAIFLHCTAPGLTPTKGCVALELRNLRRILAYLSLRTEIEICR